jgi:hypothetical protein
VRGLRITWWEAEELFEHLTERDDIWTQSDDNPWLWMRSVSLQEREEAVLALSFQPPADESSPYRCYALTVLPMAWPLERCARYLQDLLVHWTMFGERVRIERFLRSAQVHEPELLAIAISALRWTDEAKDPDADPAPVEQAALYPDVHPYPQIEIPDPLNIGTFLLTQGLGWLKLRYEAGLIRCEVSLQNAGKGHGWSHPLVGHVRPKDGRVKDAAAELHRPSGENAPQEQLQLSEVE